MGVPLLDSLNYNIFYVSTLPLYNSLKRLRKFRVTNEEMPGSSRSESKISLIFFRGVKIIVSLFA